MNKRPIDQLRDSGGMFSINNPEDGTPIKEMFAIGDELLIFTSKCTYKTQLADQIDPKRENPKLAKSVQQKLFNHGVESDALCCTLLFSKTMFRKEFLPPKFAFEKAMRHSYDAFADFVALKEVADRFSVNEAAALDKSQKLQHRDESLTIPAVGNVIAECKTFFQKADHFAASLFEIVKLFYPSIRKGGWTALEKAMNEKYGEQDYFCTVLKNTSPFLKLVRDTRDCLEHSNVRGVVVKDFAMRADGSINPPTIRVDFRGSIQEEAPLSWIMVEISKAILDTYEMTVMHLCEKHTQSFAGMPVCIRLVPENVRSNPRIRFAYGMFYADGQFIPIG